MKKTGEHFEGPKLLKALDWAVVFGISCDNGSNGLSHNFDASTKLSGLTQINSEQVATNAMVVPASVSVVNNDQKQPSSSIEGASSLAPNGLNGSSGIAAVSTTGTSSSSDSAFSAVPTSTTAVSAETAAAEAMVLSSASSSSTSTAATPSSSSSSYSSSMLKNQSVVDPSFQKKRTQNLYIHMRTRGTYSDFRIAPGGATVWHYSHSGETWFYFISPTTENLLKYEQWYMSPDHEQIFFGDLVDHCFKVQVQAGQTLIVPSGWIHAMYTRSDSIFFNSSMMHDLNIGK